MREEQEAANTQDVENENTETSLAEQEFINYCEANEIDHDECVMDDDDRKAFQKIKGRFMKAVNEKRLVVDDTKIIYTVSHFSETAGETLTISRPKGRDFIAMDGFKDTQQMQKFNAFVSSISGKEKSYVSRLDVLDRQFLQDIGTLFITAWFPPLPLTAKRNGN
jgi:hypothetical protein